MRTDAFDYQLPAELIATEPADPRDSARLMVVERAGGWVSHRRVSDLGGSDGAGPLRAGDLLVLNETKVVPAWFTGVRAGTGGRVSGLYLKDHSPGCWLVMLEANGSLRAGEMIVLDASADSDGDPPELALVEAVGGGQWVVRLGEGWDTQRVLGFAGAPPLPPYIRRRRRALDRAAIEPTDTERYNTVYACESGSVAAPTAGLHFTDALLGRLDEMGVDRTTLTLHVGPGTFAPVRADRLEDHTMHSERFSVPQEAIDAIRATRGRGGRVIAVGTTSVRALESLPDPPPGRGGFSGETELMISPAANGDPGYPFRFTDGLLTNFHLPRSTLLALVAALPGVGLTKLLHWYREAIDRGYRFYSYGDAMLIL